MNELGNMKEEVDVQFMQNIYSRCLVFWVSSYMLITFLSMSNMNFLKCYNVHNLMGLLLHFIFEVKISPGAGNPLPSVPVRLRHRDITGLL